jgi:hypothetical protein
METFIKLSNSGKSYADVKGEVTFLSLDGGIIHASTQQLKWLLSQPQFKHHVLARIQPEQLDCTPQPIDLTPYARQVVEGRLTKYVRAIGFQLSIFEDGNYTMCYGPITKIVDRVRGTETDVEVVDNNHPLATLTDVELKAHYKGIADAKKQRNIDAYNKAIEALDEPCNGWYVVTLSILVSKLRGNDGEKCYSFKVLAHSQLDAYNKACELVSNQGVKDSNVSFVYHVVDSALSAMIEYVGIWTDASETTYNK